MFLTPEYSSKEKEDFGSLEIISLYGKDIDIFLNYAMMKLFYLKFKSAFVITLGIYS